MDFIIFITLLSLLYIIISYFNIVRYFRLNFVDCKYFVADYKLLDRAIPERCIISLIHSSGVITPTINSLLDQTLSVDEIDVYSPVELKECDLKQYVNIYYSNIIHVLQKETDENTTIIFLNTNTIYSQDAIEDLINYTKQYPNKVIYVGDEFNILNGVVLKPKYINKNIITLLRNVNDINDINNILRNNFSMNTQSVSISGNYKKL
jgi:hypothetical protein